MAFWMATLSSAPPLADKVWKQAPCGIPPGMPACVQSTLRLAGIWAFATWLERVHTPTSANTRITFLAVMCFLIIPRLMVYKLILVFALVVLCTLSSHVAK